MDVVNVIVLIENVSIRRGNGGKKRANSATKDEICLRTPRGTITPSEIEGSPRVRNQLPVAGLYQSHQSIFWTLAHFSDAVVCTSGGYKAENDAFLGMSDGCQSRGQLQSK